MSSSEPQLRFTSASWRHLLPALIAIGWIIFDLLILAASLVPNRPQPSDWWLGIVLGLVFAQLSYQCFWIVWGPGRTSLRVPLGGIGITLAVMGFLRYFVYYGELELDFIRTFTSIFLILVAALVSICFCARRFFRWQLVWEGSNDPTTSLQFGLRDLLYWMALVGVTITLIRWIFSGISISDRALVERQEEAFLTIVLCLATLLQALLASWIVFGPSQPHAWLKGLGLSLLLNVLSNFPLGSNWINVVIIGEVLLLQYVSLWVCLFVLRQQGLRMIDSSSESIT